jgi:pyruvate dehydrogenase E2 component (dihydrolipoamide acetyltransferase)
MEAGSISKWNLKEGDRFEPGSSLCDVETDKATVSFDATDEGFIAKILVRSGEVKVGHPIMVIVEEASDVAAFSNFKTDVSSSEAPSPVPSSSSSSASHSADNKNLYATPSPKISPTSPSSSLDDRRNAKSEGDRIFASPLARKLLRDSHETLQNVYSAIDGQGSGFNKRIVSADVQKAISLLASQPKPSHQQASPSSASSAQKLSHSPSHVVSSSPAGPYSDFSLSESSQALAMKLSSSKQTIPHYYVSVEINLKNLTKLRETFNQQLTSTGLKKGSTKDNEAHVGISILDFLIKGAATAMKQIPDVNASWMETFVRRYDQVDINLSMGSGSLLVAPVIKDVASRGLMSVSEDVNRYETSLFSLDPSVVDKFLSDEQAHRVGTFTIHNLGVFGVKSAAPVVLSPQACALAFGTIVDTVIPSEEGSGGGKGWEVAPMMIATLSCDHRVVDGAVSAQYLAAFKQLIENPMNLML